MFHERISLNLVLLLLLVNFGSGFRLELMYISLRKYLVKSQSSPWFSGACAAANQREKFSDSNVKFRQASNRCKRVLEAAKLAYARVHYFPETWVS